ncbi:heparinase II/III family protein [Paenibacillus rhizoplanae]
MQLQAESAPSATSVAFVQTGYYVMRDPQQYLFFDAAEMGGAHGHADALNLEWMWNGQLLFTDTGRYTYEEGEWRRYFKKYPRAQHHYRRRVGSDALYLHPAMGRACG